MIASNSAATPAPRPGLARRAAVLAALLLAFELVVTLAASGPPKQAGAMAKLAVPPADELVVQATTRTFVPLVTMSVSAPLMATSYYIDSIDPGVHYSLGCSLGRRDLGLPGAQNSIVVLDFGKPVQQGSQYGTSIFTFSFASTSQIATASQFFMQGYWDCSASDQASQLRLAVGTTNFGTQVTAQHGTAWADMVNTLGDWLIDTGYVSQIRVAGANDIELAWNSPVTTRAWVDGYRAHYEWRYYDFGALEGCPPYGSCGTSSYPEWTVEDAWYKAWGAPPAWPLPEIYLTSGGNAQQWYRLSLYGYTNHGARMDIGGALTQWQACQQRGGCNGVDNTPAQGWMQMWSALRADSRTAQDLLWSADIRWLEASSGISGGAPAPAADQSEPGTAIDEAQAQALQQALAGPVDAEARQSLESKLEIIQREVAAQAAALARNIPKPVGGVAAAPSPLPEPDRPTGILEDVQGPFSSQEFISENAWQEQIGGQWTQVYAGAAANDPEQGLVMVLAWMPDGIRGSQHPTPSRAGIVRLVAASGTALTLEAADGTTFTFDAATRQFTTP